MGGGGNDDTRDVRRKSVGERVSDFEKQGFIPIIQPQAKSPTQTLYQNLPFLHSSNWNMYYTTTDGSGRLTLRNRKFLRQRTPLRHHEAPVRQESTKSFLPPITPALPPVMPDPVCPPSPPASQTRGSRQAPSVNSYPASTASLPVSSYQDPTMDSCPTCVPAQSGNSNTDTVLFYTPTPPSTTVRQFSPVPQFTPVHQMASLSGGVKPPCKK